MTLLYTFLGTFLVLCILIGVWIWIGDYGYVFRAIWYSILQQRPGPGIEDLELFPYTTIRSTNPKRRIVKSPLYGTLSLSQSDLSSLKEMETVAYLIIKEDKLLFEKYWPPYSTSRQINSFSIAKSVVATLAGIALYKEDIHSLHQPLSEIIPALNRPELEKITLYNALTMSTGLQWKEHNRNPFYDNARAYYTQDLHAIHKRWKVEREPGEVYRYISGNTLLAAEAITVQTGVSISEYAAKNLWTPLHAEYDAFWSLDRRGGREKAYCCFYATPRDMGKLGLLYLNKGRYQGNRLLDEEFIDKATTPAPLYDQIYNKPNTRYGIGWWSAQYDGVDLFYARGIRGQYIFCIPSEKMVIVRMGHIRYEQDETGHPPDMWRYIDIGMRMGGENTSV